MVKIETYKMYFRNMAIRHKLILHDPEMENEASTDVEIVANRHFVGFNIEEVIKGLATDIGPGPCLALHMYEWRMTDNSMMSIKGEYTGGFMVLKKAIPGDAVDIEACQVQTEIIMHDIQAKMRIDETGYADYNRSPFGIIDWNKTTTVNVGPIWDNHYGWFCQFVFVPRTDVGFPDNARVIEAFNAEPYILFGGEPLDYISTGAGDPLMYTTE